MACWASPKRSRSRMPAGRVASVFFKVNDDQFVEIVPGLAPGAMNRQVRVVFQSTDLKRLHASTPHAV